MTDTKFTPGPWAVCEMAANDKWHVGTTIYSTSEGRRVADAFPEMRVEDNAHLIAAAPEMYEALGDVFDALHRCGEWDEGCFYYNGTSAPELEKPLEKILAAVLKARGETA